MDAPAVVVRVEVTPEQRRRLIGLAEAARRFAGRGGRHASVSTLRTWIKEGYRPYGYRGAPVRLRAVVLGRDYCTLPEWCEEFEQARLRLGELAVPARPAVDEPAPRTRKASIRRAQQTLDEAGIR